MRCPRGTPARVGVLQPLTNPVARGHVSKRSLALQSGHPDRWRATGQVARKPRQHWVSEVFGASARECRSLTNNPDIAKEFRKEMSRFLPNHIVKDTVLSDSFWQYMSHLLDDYRHKLQQALTGSTPPTPFRM